MKKKVYFYSINFTLSKHLTNIYYNAIANSLRKLRITLSAMPDIQVTFFVDVLMMMFLRNKYADSYREIYDELLQLYELGVSMEFFLNLEWEFTQDIHALDKERILDIFAIAKYILSPFNTKNTVTNTENVNAIRIMNSKLQPFSYLLEAYYFIGIKLDASIVPKLKTRMYDYSRISSLKPHRFTSDPNISERFGNFLAISRSLYKNKLGLRFGVRNFLNSIKKTNEKHIESFLLEKSIEYSPETVFEQQHIFFLSPDFFSTKKLYELIISIRQSSESIISLESNFKDISQISFDNLLYLSEEKNGEYVSVKDIIQKKSSTHNKLLH